MVKVRSILSGFLILSILGTGCEKLLEVDSDQLVLPENHKLDSPDEIGYSIIGITSQLEKIAERYVLLGELRGDLMRVTEVAGSDLREISNFTISADNPYNRPSDYYTIINNCNYVIRNIDTSIVSNAEKIMYREYAAAKAFRAWTCMQVALNYGKVIYFEEPLLYIEDSDNSFPEYSIYELAPVLIQELEPLKIIPPVEPISLGQDLTSENLFFPVRLLLGELYLWMGSYEKAAREYHDLMLLGGHLVTDSYRSVWNVINGVFTDYRPLWSDIFDLNSGDEEKITMIAGSTEYGQGSGLDSLVYAFEIAPSIIALDHWDNQLYYHSSSTVNPGDLRKMSSVYQGLVEGYNPFAEPDEALQEGMIGKYLNMSTPTSKAIHIYRSGLLYLRFAEAINRAGKPNTAFAVLKNGMNERTFLIDSITPAREKFVSLTDSTLIDYLDFSDPLFDRNIGVHSRGCGLIYFSPDFKIPNLPTLEDSIEYVETKILEELALETAFEGNRFQDLMRIADRRSDPACLADRVSAKYDPGMQEALRSKLMDRNNWFLPLE
ncbi:MAG: RagB/SusD family nutrient uptake outer membrane protein [Bacteroidales bacterium]|nr:RagB/SusD family nutrient uptake outer membrane protein [Bacteroidales bacterium]MBN2699626.1 RagB/SusD family nutrient uptake outer membrane protein [Bacteroidales bacterium]